MTLRRTLPLLTTLGFVACGGQMSMDRGSEGGLAMSSVSLSSSSSDAEPSSGDGQLTAGAWDDNENYPLFVEYHSEHAKRPGVPELTRAEQDRAFKFFEGQRDANAHLDVALVIDTTGSMGDELDYLTNEMAHIAGRIEDAAPQALVRWSLVAYRDDGDAFVTKSIDFTPDLDLFQDGLRDHEAGGGGDYPEASAAALQEMIDLEWRTAEDVARLAFWVTDAPHHTDRTASMTEAIREAVDNDVHLYPVAASGVDQLAEITMRSAAQVTGGRYLFLTDDSGIGGEHKEPMIPCYFVTLLSDAMTRMVDIELSGEYREPDPEAIIRTGGNPLDGVCTFGDGSEVVVF